MSKHQLSVSATLLLFLLLLVASAPSHCFVSPITTSSVFYDPVGKNWAAVASACEQAGLLEKRLMNFIIRSTFHDSMAVQTAGCTNSYCGGAGTFLLLLAHPAMRV
jgi:hypothetical protein